MTPESQLESVLTTALHEYADDVHPDLDTLVTTSRAVGSRIRHRRHLGVSVGVAAAAGGIIGLASVGGLLSGGSHDAGAPGFAAQPTSQPTAHPTGPAQAASAVTRLSGIGRGAAAPGAIYHGQDVTIHLAGWRQVGPVADDKQSLSGPGGAVGDIVWRKASDYAAWIGKSGGGSDSSVWTSTVHGDVFVSIQGGQGTTDGDIQALGRSLTWN